MGDVGSGFLGFMLGALAIITAETTHISLWSWMILLAIFIGDSTVTLLRRA
jgi:Fuc2NAc and GlcNAc transferase